jgi:Nucleotidyltransferase of unknown function (DUF6036)
MNKAFPELSEALSQLLDQMDASIRKGGYDGLPITMYLAGGMAVNFYCGTRYTEDVDAFYTHRVHVGPCEVSYRHKDGNSSFLYLDNNYNPTFGLLHENHDRDAVEWTGIGNEKRKIHLYVLSPVDLAVTKISRYSPQDREDILALAIAGLFSAEQLRDRAIEALGDYIGDHAPVMTSIELICGQISAEKSPQFGREPEFSIDPPNEMEGKDRELEI